MKFSASHLKRYRQIVSLLWKYGHADLAQQMSAEEGFGAGEPPAADGPPEAGSPPPEAGAASPKQLADDLEAMGPTYVKLGQVLAGRPDLLPDNYRAALERLQDKVKPFSYAEVEKIVVLVQHRAPPQRHSLHHARAASQRPRSRQPWQPATRCTPRPRPPIPHAGLATRATACQCSSSRSILNVTPSSMRI